MGTIDDMTNTTSTSQITGSTPTREAATTHGPVGTRPHTVAARLRRFWRETTEMQELLLRDGRP